MPWNSAELVEEITRLHAETVTRWHVEPLDNPYHGFLEAVCQQHQFNFLLWHEEDIARSPEVGDDRIAQVKRAIDGYNQQRNDWIERLDEILLQQLDSTGMSAAAVAPLNTETPGSAMDRLSILSLRRYHLEEQLTREDIGQEHVDRVSTRIDICRQQHHDLATALTQLLQELATGRKRLKLYRQLKMYNDPQLNPYLYKSGSGGSG